MLNNCVRWGYLTMVTLACVASVSVRFRSKERGRRVKDPEKNGASKRAGRGWGRKEGNFNFLPSPPPPPTFTFWLLFHFSRGQNRESRSSVFLCSETKRKRLLRRLGSRDMTKATKTEYISTENLWQFSSACTRIFF